MLNLQHVSKHYPGEPPVLDDLSLQIAAGDYVAIMGESGSGKSTLLNMIAGLDTPDSGQVILDGQDFSVLSDGARTTLRANTIGFIFQAFHLLPHLSLLNNVGLPLALLGRPVATRYAQARTLLADLDLAGKESRLPRELSGGEMQRAAIARALIHEPKLVLADEPTGNLDSHSADTVLALLKRQIKSRGTAGILVTHSLAAAQTADRILLLKDGKLEPRDP